jgi:hypothetical protein
MWDTTEVDVQLYRWSSLPEWTWAGGPPKVMKNVSVQQPLSAEPSPFPLSSRAKPRDLQFLGSFMEMFSTARSGVEISAVSLSALTQTL